MSWEQDKRWSDRFLPEIKRHLGEHLIGEPPFEEDQKRNTDLIVLRMDAVRIACRIRKFSYWPKYPDEFTLRESRPNGAETELGKVIKGWGDYIFYGFADEAEKKLHAWFLGDLKVFRGWWAKEQWAGRKPGFSQQNGDGSSGFRAFARQALPPEFVVARNAGAVAHTEVA